MLYLTFNCVQVETVPEQPSSRKISEVFASPVASLPVTPFSGTEPAMLDGDRERIVVTNQVNFNYHLQLKLSLKNLNYHLNYQLNLNCNYHLNNHLLELSYKRTCN